MKNLTLGMLITTAGLGGCVIVDDHHHGGGGGNAALLTAHWELKNVDSQVVTACPVGFNTGNIITQMVDSTGRNIGPPQNDLFFCEDHVDTLALDPGIYQISVAIENRDSNANLIATFAESLADTVDLTAVDGTYDTEILNDGGRVTFGWDLVGGVTQDTLDCTSLGNGGLGAISTDVADATHAVDTTLNCADLFVPVSGPKALTGDLELAAGNWTMKIQATNGDTPLSDVVSKTVTMANRDDLQDLGTVQLTITGK